MYQMIIIDDESLTLNFLTEFINNEFPDIKVVATFDISSDALEYLKTHNVDIVLTDISMPKPTGIDIAEYCHRSLPNTLVIFFSAYQEFEYAHSAITFKVHDYVLKPLSKKSLVNTLSSAIAVLKKKNSVLTLDSFASDAYILLCQEVFSDLICSHITSISDIEEKLDSLGLSSSILENKTIVVNLYLKDLTQYLDNIWKHSRTALFDSLLRLICKETDSVFYAPIWYTHNKIEIIAIGKNTEITFEQILYDFQIQIQNEIFEFLKLNLKISITKQFDSILSMVSESKSVKTDNNLAKRIYEYIEQNYNTQVTLEDMARHFNFSRVYFSAYYKKCIGENFSTTLKKIRINKAKELLQNPTAKVVNVMHEVGYKNSSHFHSAFKNIVGCSPSEYQQRFR